MVNDSMTMDENVDKKLDEEDPKNEDNLKNEDKDFFGHSLNLIELNFIVSYTPRVFLIREIDFRGFFLKSMRKK